MKLLASQLETGGGRFRVQCGHLEETHPGFQQHGFHVRRILAQRHIYLAMTGEVHVLCLHGGRAPANTQYVAVGVEGM